VELLSWSPTKINANARTNSPLPISRPIDSETCALCAALAWSSRRTCSGICTSSFTLPRFHHIEDPDRDRRAAQAQRQPPQPGRRFARHHHRLDGRHRRNGRLCRVAGRPGRWPDQLFDFIVFDRPRFFRFIPARIGIGRRRQDRGRLDGKRRDFGRLLNRHFIRHAAPPRRGRRPPRQARSRRSGSCPPWR